jgi:transcriptional regulator with XRE-family HTH domain
MAYDAPQMEQEQTLGLAVPVATPVADLVRFCRVVSGLSRHEMARKIGVSKRTYDRIEDGSRPPRRGELLAIAQVSDQDPELIFGASLDAAAESLTLPLLPGAVKDEGAPA